MMLDEMEKQLSGPAKLLMRLSWHTKLLMSY